MPVSEKVKEKRKWKKIQDCFWKQCLVCVGLLGIVFWLYYCTNIRITHRNDLKKITSDDFSFMFQIDAIREEKNFYVLDGWAFKLGVNATQEDMEIMLYNEEKGEIIYPNSTECVLREDVNEYFLCEHNYSESGMSAKFRINKRDILNVDYEVLIRDVTTEKIYQTGTFIVNGKVTSCLPDRYKELQVVGTELEGIVEEGVLRACLPNEGIYIYQNEDRLYFVADKNFQFAENDATYIGYLLGTTQVNKLPQWRLDNNRVNDARDFLFENMEINVKDADGYRVAEVEVPDMYAVTYITVNRIDKENDVMWNVRFRPWFPFEE